MFNSIVSVIPAFFSKSSVTFPGSNMVRSFLMPSLMNVTSDTGTDD